LFDSELIVALASATQLNILDIIGEMCADPVVQELQDLRMENGQIIESVRQKGVRQAG
jgi:hypothetical protein